MKFRLKPGYYTALLLLLSSCSTRVSPLQYNRDNCEYCKMKLVDEKFGAELITVKGKTMKFDDAGCMLNLEKESLGADQIQEEWVADYMHPGNLIRAFAAVFLKDSLLKSPMGSNLAAFDASRNDIPAHHSASERITWTEVKKTVKK
ncbi:MAG: nitrous oxide reductase accessory protein NosL [Bacteroidia bacterium]